MRTIVGGDDLILGRIMQDSHELILSISQGDTEIDQTKFYFQDGLNLGLDPGYDAGHFNQQAALISRLVEEDEGVGLAINSMGLENIDDVVIPLVINREAADGFRVSIHTNGIYEGTNVYLEDNQLGTMTLLNQQDFELIPEINLSEVGRFYLHLTQTTFSIEDETLTNHLNAYKLDSSNFITIEGLAFQSNQTNLRLYNILGQQVLQKTLANNSNRETVSTEGFATGVYVIKLKSENVIVTKKIVIKK